MSIMGRVYLTCDSKGCHGEEIIEAEDFNGDDIKHSLKVSATFAGWTMDDDGGLHCPACNEERDDAYERAAARYDGSGKDWR
jgi:hypothetical protein